jgi:glycosyltransferase involved in cell wall biosynthesis
MKILFAHRRMLHPFGVGGDTVSLDHFLFYLHAHGHLCEALGTLTPQNYVTVKENVIEGLTKRHIPYTKEVRYFHPVVSRHNFPYIYIPKIIRYANPYTNTCVDQRYFSHQLHASIENTRPDILLTQLEGSDEVIAIAQCHTTPVLLFIQDISDSTKQRIRDMKVWKGVTVIFLSRYAAAAYRSSVRCKSHIIYPPIRQIYKDYSRSVNAPYVTIMNPVKEKGGAVVQDLVQMMPDIDFLIVEGWRKLEDLPYNFAYPNVHLLRYQTDCSKVYKRTKLLLVPSQWEEGFGRVVTEAGAYGAPSIVSQRGGLPEAVGAGGIIVKDFASPAAWEKAIRKTLKDRALYHKLSDLAKQNALRFALNTTGKQLLRICQRLINTKQT